MIERDADIPPLADLLAELDIARGLGAVPARAPEQEQEQALREAA